MAFGVADFAVAAGENSEVAAGIKQQGLGLKRITEVKLGVIVADAHVAEDFDTLEVLCLCQRNRQKDEDSLHFYMI